MRLSSAAWPLYFLQVFAVQGEENVVWRPFNNESPWNQKIPSDVKLDSASQELISDLANAGALYVNINDWSIPLYFVDSENTPLHNVEDSRPGVYGKGFEFPRSIPIPDNAIASPPTGGDEHMCIVDKKKGIEWGMWATRKVNGHWFTGLGAVTDLNGTGVAPPWNKAEREFDAHRARASGFPLVAGLIRVEEIEAGKIEHALVFAYPYCRTEHYIQPASTAQVTFEQTRNNYQGIPMGGRIRLNPNWDVEGSALSPTGKIIARALQDYGAYCGDFAGAFVIYAENSLEALEQWEGILNTDEFMSVFTPEMIETNFQLINMGEIKKGQNFKENQ